MHLKQSRGNNSEGMKVRVVILVWDTLSWPVLHNYEVSWLYFKGYSSYRADTNIHKKASKRRQFRKYERRALIFVCDTSPWTVLHNCEVSSKYSKQYSSYCADTKMFTEGRRDDNRTPGSSIYPPNLWVGDINWGNEPQNLMSGHHLPMVLLIIDHFENFLFQLAALIYLGQLVLYISALILEG